MNLPLIIGITIYVIGFIITILICHKLDVDDDEMIVSAWFWPIILGCVLAWGIMQLPLYVCKLADVVIDKLSKEEDK